MQIGEKSIAMATEQVGELLAIHRMPIGAAFLKAEKDFPVSLKVTFIPWKGGVRIVTDIAYTPEKIKDQTDGIVDEDQTEMFEDR